ncbi:MAG: leucine-rich repeat domain-containing protein, partial [Eubacterium sp.]
MKRIKSIIALLLSVLIIFTAIPTTALAADNDISAVNDYCEWSYDSSTGTLYINTDGALVSPDKGNHGTYKGGYIPLIKNDGTLFNAVNVKKLIFGKDITSIDDISLKHNQKYYGISEYIQFKKLESIEFEQGSQLKSISDYFCYDAITGLKEISFPDTLESLGDYAFYRCTGLTEIDLSNTEIAKINNCAFYGCTGLTKVVLPQHDVSIGSKAFYCCTNITDLVNSKYLIGVYDYGMYHCTSLGLTDLSGLVSAGQSAFEGDENLTAELTDITSAGENAFSNTGITSLDCTNSPYLALGIKAFGYCKKLETVKLPISANYTFVGSYAFHCSSVSNVEIHNNVTTIGEFAFYGTEISDFNMPDNIGNIGQYAFAGCKNLEYIELPESLKTLGTCAFMSSGIKNAVVRCANVNVSDATQWSNIGLCYGVSGSKITDYTSNNYLKEYCTKNAISYATGEETEFSTDGICQNGKWYVSPIPNIGNKLYVNVNGKLDINSFTASNGKTMTSGELENIYKIMAIEFESGITDIGDDVFYAGDNTFMHYQYGLVLPSTLKTIGNNTFRKSTLTELLIPDNVESISKYSFADSFIYTLSLSNGLTEIPEGAFYNTRTTEIDIPSNITKLDKKSFGAFETNEFYADHRIVRIPATVTEIYYDLDNPADNAVGFTSDGKADENVTLYVVPGSAGYEYALKTGANYKLNIIDNKGYACNYIEKNKGYEEDLESMTWSYDEDTATLTISGKGVFNADTLYYSDGTKVGRNDFPVDKIVFEEGIIGLDLRYPTVSISSHTYISILTTFNPKDVDLPNSLETIGSDIFYNCTNLTAVIIPDNVTNLGEDVFENCNSLQAISFGKNLYAIPRNLFKNSKNLRFVNFGGVKEIGAEAFKNCSHLEEIVLPDSVTTIGNEAFYGCVSVQSISIGSSVESVGKRAFANMPLCEKIATSSDVFNQGVVKGTEIFINTGCSTSGVTVVFDKSETADFKPFSEMKVTAIELGSNVSIIKNQQYLTNLKEITVNND